MYNDVYFTFISLYVDKTILSVSLITLCISIIAALLYKAFVIHRMRINKRSATIVECVSLLVMYAIIFGSLILGIIAVIVAMVKASNALTMIL